MLFLFILLITALILFLHFLYHFRSDTEIVVINTNLITNIESAIPDEYSSLHMFVNIIVIMAKRGYELSGNAEVFAEVLRVRHWQIKNLTVEMK